MVPTIIYSTYKYMVPTIYVDTLPSFTCLKSKTETHEQCVKSVQS